MKAKKINNSEYCCTTTSDIFSRLYKAEDEIIRLRMENLKLYNKLISSNQPFFKELECRVRNILSVLNSCDTPLAARLDVSRTQLFSVLSLISQLTTNYEQKNR